MIETIVIVILAVAFAFALIYLKKEKVSGESSTPKKSGAEPAVAKAAAAAKTEAPAAEKAVVAEAVQSPAPVETPAPAEAVPAVAEDLDDSILKRHHLSNVRQMVMATTFPHPTDSALSRHYDEMIDAKAEECLENEAKMARLVADYEVYLAAELTAKKSLSVADETVCDEEPMLRRHHLHHVRMMVAATTFPHPTDSALSRHYDEMVDAKAEDCLADEAKMARLIADYAAYEKAGAVETHSQSAVIPEDSMLRRHYLAQLQAAK